MSETNQSGSNTQLNKNSRSKAKLAANLGRSEGEAGLVQHPAGSFEVQVTGGDDQLQTALQRRAFRGGSFERQINSLHDTRLLTVQRQVLAARVGRVQGNRHLQRVITTLTPNNQKINGSIQCQQAGTQPSPAQVVTTRAQAAAELRRRWGVGTVSQGTLQSQAQDIRRLNSREFRAEASPPDAQAMLTQANWQAWLPPDGSALWAQLIAAFEDFERALGTVPAVREIVFYETEYNFVPSANGGPRLQPESGELASFSGGRINVYHAAETRAPRRGLPSGRSQVGRPARVSRPTTEAGFRFTMVHEISHGLLEEVIQDTMQNNPQRNFMQEYAHYVGWFNGMLYDSGVEAVRTAIANNQTPDRSYRIVPHDWNNPRWQQQPVTRYMAEKGPHEDFPEAVATYITNPTLLRARSSRRYEFIHNRLATFRRVLQQNLRQRSGSRTPGTSSSPQTGEVPIQPSPVGDFFKPPENVRVA